MRLVVQRALNASVEIENKVVGKIGNGLFVLVGIKNSDSEDSVDYLAEKLVKLRVMADDQGKMNLSIKEKDAKILVVSQFTLYADTTEGNRPSFIEAAQPEKAENLYSRFIISLKEKGINVETGKFSAYMKINAQLDGPVTIILEK